MKKSNFDLILGFTTFKNIKFGVEVVSSVAFVGEVVKWLWEGRGIILGIPGFLLGLNWTLAMITSFTLISLIPATLGPFLLVAALFYWVSGGAWSAAFWGFFLSMVIVSMVMIVVEEKVAEPARQIWEKLYQKLCMGGVLTCLILAALAGGVTGYTTTSAQVAATVDASVFNLYGRLLDVLGPYPVLQAVIDALGAVLRAVIGAFTLGWALRYSVGSSSVFVLRGVGWVVMGWMGLLLLTLFVTWMGKRSHSERPRPNA